MAYIKPEHNASETKEIKADNFYFQLSKESLLKYKKNHRDFRDIKVSLSGNKMEDVSFWTYFSDEIIQILIEGADSKDNDFNFTTDKYEVRFKRIKK